MRRVVVAVLAAAGVLTGCGPARAQAQTEAQAQTGAQAQRAAPATAAPLADPEASIVEELVVVARDRGPAWWRVSDDDTTVYILALPDGPLPPDLAWDPSGLNRRLKGANALVGAQRTYRIGFSFKNIGLLLSLRRSLRQKGTMEDDLPEPLRARFVAAREVLGKDAGRYAGWGPMVAGFLVLNDARSAGPRWKDPTDEIRKAARRLRVREREPEKHDAVPVLKEFQAGLTMDLQTTCLSAALDDVEEPVADKSAAAQGWAHGDVAAALKGRRNVEKCFLALGGGEAVWKQGVEDQAAAIAAELEKPGKAVAVVRLRQLIARGGVIERLESLGLEVEGPAVR